MSDGRRERAPVSPLGREGREGTSDNFVGSSPNSYKIVRGPGDHFYRVQAGALPFRGFPPRDPSRKAVGIASANESWREAR